MKLSVIVPAIRKPNWAKLYESVVRSYHGEVELFLIGPYEPDFKANGLRWVEDWGSPVRCMQRAISLTDAEWITFGADDGFYTPNSLDKVFELVGDYKTVIVAEYIESDNPASFKVMTSSDYYRINYHNGLKANIPDEYMEWMGGACSTRLFKEIGGFDCKFETGAFALIDLSIRLQMYGAKFVLQDNVIFLCSWSPGVEGDHGPIHTATMENDLPYYYRLYRETKVPDRITVPFNNWRDQPSVWERRFKK